MIEQWNAVTTDKRLSCLALCRRLDFNPTLRPDWVDLVVKSLGKGRGDLSAFIECSSDGEVRAYMPVLQSRVGMAGISMNVVEPASNLMSYHAEIVAEGDVVGFLRNVLRAVPMWDLFRMSNVVVGGATSLALDGLAAELGTPLQVIPGESSPYLAINGDWKDYLATRNKKFRYKLRRRRETLENMEGFELTWWEGPTGMDFLLDKILTIESRSWKAREGVDIPSSAQEVKYHRELLPFLAERDMLFANVVSVANRPVAYNLCCRCGGWFGQLKTSFDESFEELSPGAFVIDAAVQKAIELGAREFDFLGDADPHKLVWTDAVRAHASYFLFGPRLKPRIVGTLKLLANRFRTAASHQRPGMELPDRGGEGP